MTTQTTQLSNGARTSTAVAEPVQQPSEPKKVTSQVLLQVERLRASGNLTLPSDYNVGNALNSAWLKLQTVNGKENRALIKGGAVDVAVASLTSVANALHDYVIQGLNCAKNQAYFIVYGDQLVCQRSYFGDMVVAERIRPGIVFYYDTIREGESFASNKQWSKNAGLVDVIAEHSKPFPRNASIVGAYCGAIDGATGEHIGLTLFDMARIKKSWGMSKTYKWSKPDKPTTHDEFPEEMALRTVIRHCCKGFINASSDSELSAAIRRQDDDSIEAEVAEEASLHANREVLSIEAPRNVDRNTGEIRDEQPGNAYDPAQGAEF